MENVLYLPKERNLERSRHFIRLVNSDQIFLYAQERLKADPRMLYNQVRKAGVARVRMVTAYVLSLFENGYFEVDRNGSFDPTLDNQKKRARNMLIHICQSSGPIYLGYAGDYFFKHFPQFVAKLREDGERASI